MGYSTLTRRGRSPVIKRVIRVGGAIALPAILRERGIDADALIAEAGLQAAAFDHPDNVIPFAKLGELAHRDRDPEMLEYVVDNVGKGVPANAPHMARLRAMKEQLLAELRGIGNPSAGKAKSGPAADPHSVNLVVENGSGRSGAAGADQGRLPRFDAQHGDEKQADVVVHPLHAGLVQAAAGAAPRQWLPVWLQARWAATPVAASVSRLPSVA